MTAPNQTQQRLEVPAKLVGGCKFGRFPKISQEQTWNFIVSDGFLVPYSGWKEILSIAEAQEGRGEYSSSVGNIILTVIGTVVYQVFPINTHLDTPQFGYSFVGDIATSSGDVYMAENLSKQILITDGFYIYAWDYNTKTFYSSAPGATNAISFPYPKSGYCAFQNGRFIVCINDSQTWALSLTGSITQSNFFDNTNSSLNGTIQTKPGYIQASIPMPGGGNNIIIMGSNVCEMWQDVGAALFPYQRLSTFNIDYGCANPASIGVLDNHVVWIAVNELAGPILLYTDGGAIKRISTDGIDYKLSNLTNPSDCTGFLFRQDGHLIYQFTFIQDNLTYAYDFNTELFSIITDENLNYHPARQVVFFLNNYYFISLKDGNLYQFDTKFTSAEYFSGNEMIPRIRVLPPFRFPTQRYFIGNSLGFTIENGEPNDITVITQEINKTYTLLTTESGIFITTESGIFLGTEQFSGTPVVNYISSANIQLSISVDGGETFGPSDSLPMNPTGRRTSRCIWYQLGIMNDVTCQLRFNSFERFVVTDGILDVYQ